MVLILARCHFLKYENSLSESISLASVSSSGLRSGDEKALVTVVVSALLLLSPECSQTGVVRQWDGEELVQELLEHPKDVLRH